MNMKNLIIIITIAAWSITRLSAQSPTKSKADLAWEALPKYNYKAFENDKFQHKKSYEIYLRKYLMEGYKFWHRFPNDKRRTQWLLHLTFSGMPEFWKNIDEGASATLNSRSYSAPINWSLLNLWEKKLIAIRKSFMTDRTASSIDKRSLKLGELSIELSRSFNLCYRRDKDNFINKIKSMIPETFATYTTDANYFNLKRICDRLFLYNDDYGLKLNDLYAIFKFFEKSRDLELKTWASTKTSLLAATHDPFKLKLLTVDGSEIDFSKLYGKVVLIDFWSKNCSDCVARMPIVKQIYDKYKNDGFIVVSAAFNSEIDREIILKIHNKVGADWPLVILGGDTTEPGHLSRNDMGKDLWKKYSFSYVPQMLLLDKEGKLVEYNGVLIHGDFEPIVKKLLSK